MEIQNFTDIEPEFIERVHRMVWCSLATVGPDNRPRSRVLHTMWQGSVGWLLTRRHTFKTQHLAHNPYVSLAYITDILKPVYAECRAEWVDDPGEKQRRWDWFKNTPPPLGYDPAMAFESPDHPNYGVLRLIPWRIELYELNGEKKVWRA